jgi:hypothetical protein
MKKFQIWSAIGFLILLTIGACKKKDSDYLTSADLVAHFTNKVAGSYIISTPTTTYKVPVGITNPSSSNTTINVTVTSPTGAVQGTHYTLSSTSIVLAPGKTIDSIEVKGVQSQYLSGRKDTLVFTIQDANPKAAPYNKEFKLLMRGPCFAGDIATDLASLLGTYASTNELLGTGAYGPYTTKITAAVQTSPTTADITVTNLYDDNPSWGPLKFTLDWSNLASPTITLVTQVAGGNAGNTFGAAYAGLPHVVRPVAAAQGSLVGTFDFCAQKLTLVMQIGVQTPTGNAFSSSIYQVKMAR